MSIHLAKQAPNQASFLSNLHQQLFRPVPPIPADLTLHGKTALITGSNIGLGLECARQFLHLHPTRLILAVRSLPKGTTAAATLRRDFPNAQIDVWQLDMSSMRSVQAFAAKCERELLDGLHVAVLNAALGKAKFERVEEEEEEGEGGKGRGHETTLQVNFLSTALLAVLLLPTMKLSASSASSPDAEAAAGPARLTIITSDASLGVKLEDPGDIRLLDSLERPESFVAFEQYAVSKLLITMFSARLAETIDPNEVVINCCNPGATKGTVLMREMDSWVVKMVMAVLYAIVGRNVEDGARIYVHAALVLGKESHGSFTDWLVKS